jgi:hypothetical protein
MVAWTLRAMGRTNEAIAIQLRLEREGDADGKPDPYVFEELALLYRSTGDETKAAHYANRKAGRAGALNAVAVDFGVGVIVAATNLDDLLLPPPSPMRA